MTFQVILKKKDMVDLSKVNICSIKSFSSVRVPVVYVDVC